MKITIVGAGISGLATAHALLTLNPDVDLDILESAERAGGKAWTDHTPEGYACEWGVNGFLDNKPKTLELADSLGLTALPGDAAAKRRYVFRNGQLHALPESPLSFLTSGLMSLPGRLRVGLEPLISRGKLDDETLYAFASRRLGAEAAEALIDPMASGVFAGDPQKMSLKSCFPRINEIENEYGSLVRGMLRLQLKARREGKGKGPGPGPGGNLTSFAGGMSELIDRLTVRLGTRLKTSSRVEHIARISDGYALHLDNGQERMTNHLVLAAPAWAQADMLRDLSPATAGLLDEIEYPPLSVVCLGFRVQDLASKPDGFGFLVPASEKRKILGTIVDSNVFPNRAPENHVLLRTMVGGSRAAEMTAYADAELADQVLDELNLTLNIQADPVFARVYHHDKAIPQYHVGHAERLLAIDASLKPHPGLVLTGNAYRGVSLNDCVANAWETASKFVS